MTKREVLWGLLAMVLGVLVGVFVMLRRYRPPVRPPPVETDASAPEADASEPPDDAAVTDALEDADLPLDDDASLPPLSLDAGKPVHVAPRPDAARPAPHPKLREANLEVRLVGADGMCVDAPRHGPRLQLFPCHGKANQRWTFTEDLNGTNVISGDGDCWRVGPPTTHGEAAVDRGACGSGSARFRLTDDRRLEDAHSGLCVTVRDARKRSRLFFAACDPSHGGQTWSLNP
jgi:hypothetical protein